MEVSLLDSSWFNFTGLVALIVASVEVTKRVVGLNTRFAPVAALVWALIWAAIAFGLGFIPQGWVAVIAVTLVAWLAATGGYSAARTLIKG